MISRKTPANRGAELLTAMGVLLLFALCGAVYYCAALLGYDRYYPNVFIDGKAVGGKTVSEVNAMFEGQQSLSSSRVIVMLDESSWPVDLTSLSATYQVPETLKKAYSTGREGGVFRRLSDILALRGSARDFSIQIGFNEAQLHEQVDKMADTFTVKPQDAKLDFRPDTAEAFVVTNEVTGRTVDRDALYQTLAARIAKGDFTTLKLTSTKLSPSVTADELTAGTQLVGTYTTALYDEPKRNNNIMLASKATNGTVIKPGDQFSFNDTTGERTLEAGYEEAATISSAQLVDAPGGGVCQVSTSIYNAALTAGLQIVERHHHTWPMSYAAAGLDATVDFGRKDLRLKNTRDMPVYLIMKMDAAKHTLTAEIYGKPAAEEISVKVENVERIKPDSPTELANPDKYIGYRRVITEARDGVRVKVYRVYTKNGAEERRDLVSEDYYAPEQGQVEVGTKQPVQNSGDK